MKFKLKVRLTKQVEKSAVNDYNQAIMDGKTPIEALNQMADKSEKSAATAAAIMKKYGKRNGKIIASAMASTGNAPTESLGERTLTQEEKIALARSVHTAMSKASQHSGSQSVATPLKWTPTNGGQEQWVIGRSQQAKGHDGTHTTAHHRDITPASQPTQAGLTEGSESEIPPVPLGIDVSAFMRDRDQSMPRVGQSTTNLDIMKAVIDPLKRKNQLAGKLIQALSAITKNRTVRDQEDGELDMDKLSDIATGNNLQRVFQQVTLGKRLDTVVQILCDFSGSMSSPGRFETMTDPKSGREPRYDEQATWEALQKIGKCHYGNIAEKLSDDGKLFRVGYRGWDKMIAAVRLCKMLTETFEMLRIPCEIIAYDSSCYMVKNYHERSTMIKWECLYPAGSTLLPVAILEGIGRLRTRKEKRKIQIAITDGDLGGMNDKQYKLADPRREVEIYAFGIGIDFNFLSLLQDYGRLDNQGRGEAVAQGVSKYLNNAIATGKSNNPSRHLMQSVFKKHISGITPENLEARITETVCQAITGHNLSTLH